MKKFIIERNLPGASKLTSAELKAFAIRSCEAIDNLEASYHWLETFVTDNKVYCIHIAPDLETAWEHALKSGLPITHIAEIKKTLDPTTTTLPVEKQLRRVFE